PPLSVLPSFPTRRSSDLCAVGDLQFDEAEPRGGLQLRQPGFLEPHVVIVAEVVHPQHLVTALEEPPGDMVADEARCTGHQDHSIDRKSTRLNSSHDQISY